MGTYSIARPLNTHRRLVNHTRRDDRVVFGGYGVEDGAETGAVIVGF